MLNLSEKVLKPLMMYRTISKKMFRVFLVVMTDVSVHHISNLI
nr:MAG TPA: hypothetical protein [Caudoviricetes sp.]DAY93585.1 MAG TPA: hypothetical protein [Caudoviricetes sp.]